LRVKRVINIQAIFDESFKTGIDPYLARGPGGFQLHALVGVFHCQREQPVARGIADER